MAGARQDDRGASWVNLWAVAPYLEIKIIKNALVIPQEILLNLVLLQYLSFSIFSENKNKLFPPLKRGSGVLPPASFQHLFPLLLLSWLV